MTRGGTFWRGVPRAEKVAAEGVRQKRWLQQRSLKRQNQGKKKGGQKEKKRREKKGGEFGLRGGTVAVEPGGCWKIFWEGECNILRERERETLWREEILEKL